MYDRIMGLDVGSKTVGVAVSDALGFTAQPVTVVRRRSLAADLQALREIAVQYEAVKLVVGLPRNMNGTYGSSAEMVQEFAAQAGEALGLPVDFWDERLTTAMADQALIQADVSRRNRRQVVDKIAAVIILQSYMDRRRNDGR